MSYDLYFTAPKISNEQFCSYFAENPLYKVANNQAWYANADTGVYFSFDYNEEPAAEEGEIEHSVMFNMNFYRPHYFALEAEPEVSRFVGRFKCTIHDPQNDGMENGPYTPDGFLKGWNHGNEFGYSAILCAEKGSEIVYSRPTDELEANWLWNFKKSSREQSIELDIFVPRIMFALVNQRLSSFCVWPDGISTLIPKVDCLWIPREKLAPKPFFTKPKEDFCIIPFSDALPVLKQYRVEGYEMDAYELPSPDTPSSIKKFVQRLKPFKGERSGVAMDSVLNQEWVDKYRGRS